MPDIVTPEARSRMMSGIKGKNTRPELAIRHGLHNLGFRYRLHDPHLPGKPDLVLKKYRTAIFVNGCFWHGHSCHLFKWPGTRDEFWRQKIGRTRDRDIEKREILMALGWRIIEVWECALKGRTRMSQDEVISRIVAALESDCKYTIIEGCDENTL